MNHDRNPHDAIHGRAPTPDERLHALLGDGLDGVPVTPDEEAAARLTAHALGELFPGEAAEIERRLAGESSAAERAAVTELGALGEVLRRPVTVTSAPCEPVGSPSIRTAVTAALALRSSPTDPPRAPLATTPPAASRARRGMFSRGPLSALPLLVAAGTTAAAVLAVIMTREQPDRDDLFRSPARQTEPMKQRKEEVVEAPRSSFDLPAEPAAAGAKAEAPVDAFVVDSAPRFSLDPQGQAAPAPAPLGDVLASKKRLESLSDEMAVAESVPRLYAQTDPAMAGRGGSLEGTLAQVPHSPAPGAAEGRGTVPLAASPADGEIQLGRNFSFAPEQRGRRAAGGAVVEAKEGGDRTWFRDRDVDRLDLSTAAPGTDRYARFVENAFRNPNEQPLSTFSIDVDTASYALVRRFLHDRQLPPADAVRLEEMLNYFRYDDAAPAGDDPFSVSLETAACPWREGHRLVRVGLKGREIAANARPGTSLVFLVDVSGSMNEPNKLPLVKQSLSMLVDQLTENDKVAIVTYAGDAGLKLAPTSGDQKARIRGAIDALAAGGSTNGSAGIELAYAQAAEAFVKGGSNRVVLATDGDLNVGITDDAALVELIKRNASGGVFLTVLGYGQGNLQDEKMEKLADNGNGIYAYIDGAREARKVLVEQLTGSTVTIAKDVKIQVEFNPAQVAAYRLLGYENRIMAAKDFKDDTKDAGEIGAGHGVTALYEIVPNATAAKSPVIAEPLKYQPKEGVAARPAEKADTGPASSELLTLKLRYKEPTGDTSSLREFPLEDTGTTFENASTNLRFAAAVAEFGMLLRSSAHRGEASLSHVTATAAGALGTDPGGLRAEFLDLVREAGALLPHRGGPIPN